MEMEYERFLTLTLFSICFLPLPSLDVCTSSVQWAISLTTPLPSRCLINSLSPLVLLDPWLVRWNKSRYPAIFSTDALNSMPVSRDNIGKASDQARLLVAPLSSLPPNPFLTQATTTCEEKQKMDALGKVYHRAVRIPLDNVSRLVLICEI